MAFVYSRVKFVYAHMEFDMILNTDKLPLTKYSYKNMTERKKELITTRKFSVKKKTIHFARSTFRVCIFVLEYVSLNETRQLNPEHRTPKILQIMHP